MPSDQWEVVTKSKKQKNLERKVFEHGEMKRIAALPPKLEELLPYDEFFAANNNNHKKQSSAIPNSRSSSKNKSPRKTNSAMKTATTVETAKKQQTQPKQQLPKPKTLEQTLRSMTVDEFTAQLQQAKLNSPDSQLRWLSHVSYEELKVANYFNTQLTFDCDPLFSGRSNMYPSVLLSAALKKAILEFLESMGGTNLTYFFYALLDSMAVELNLNRTVVGYKLMLQLIGQNWPNICSADMVKTAMLRNLYQNRSMTGLSILWTIGQGGYQSLTEGVRVWHNLMLPCLELKHYTQFVVDYIDRVLNEATARGNEVLNINQKEFFIAFRALNASYPNMAKPLQVRTKSNAARLLQIYVASNSKNANVFLTLLREIQSHKDHTLIDGCLSCLLSSSSEDCIKVWRMNYKKQQLASLILLMEIEKTWSNGSNALAEVVYFQTFLEESKALNEELSEAKHCDFIRDWAQLAKTVQEKSSAQQKKNKQTAAQKKKCGCCKWTLGSLFIIALIGGALFYDTETNGKGVFEKSATGKVLKNAGALPYVQKGWYLTMSNAARAYKWGEQHVPPYAQPALKLTSDLYKLGRNTACNMGTAVSTYWNTKWPVLAKFIDNYVPNLSVKLEGFAVATKNLVVSCYDKSATIVKENVLVGRFSPENINKALNQTRNAALDYYNIFHRKVDAYAKLK